MSIALETARYCDCTYMLAIHFNKLDMHWSSNSNMLLNLNLVVKGTITMTYSNRFSSVLECWVGWRT